MSEIDVDAVYKKLKKQNGEAFVRVMRDAVLLDVPNIVHILEFAGKDAAEAQKLVPLIREVYKDHFESEFQTTKDPLELLSDAGYDAFVVKNEEQKNSIKKYYRPGEEICTLRDPRRHIDYYIIHAIKRGADEIKPSEHPEREDEYGRSVISIQILKTGGFISIKNRYNHTVNNPDATFNNNPDEIIPGLSDSLKKYFHVDFNATKSQLPNHFRIVGDQLVFFNYETNNFYFGPDYYFSGSTVTKLNNTNQILFYNGFVLNIAKGNSHIESISGAFYESEFCDELNNFIRGKKITRTVAADKTITILVDGERFMDIKDGLITFIHAPNFNTINFEHGVDLSGDLDFSGVKDLSLAVQRGGREPWGAKITSIKFNPNASSIYIAIPVTLRGDLDFSGVNSLNLCHQPNLSNVTNIKLNPDAHRIELQRAVLSGDVDLSGVEQLNIVDCNFLNTKSIKFNPNAQFINVSSSNPKFKLSGILDFSFVQELCLHNFDLTNVTDIKFPIHASKVDLSDCHGLKLSGDLDFSGISQLNLGDADLSNVKSIRFRPQTPGAVTGIRGLNVQDDFLSFAGVHHLSIHDSDFTKANGVKFNPEAAFIELHNVKLFGDLDFSDVRHLDLSGCDLTNVKSIKFNSRAAVIKLNGTKLSGDLDFSDVGDLDLSDTDLTDVTNIKFNLGNSNARITLQHIKLMGDLDFSSIGFLDLSGADLNDVTTLKLNGSFDLDGAKSEKPLKLDFSGHPLRSDAKDWSGLKNVQIIGTPARFTAHFERKKLAGLWDFSSDDHWEIKKCDLSNVTDMKFQPGSTIKLEQSKLGGNLDFRNAKTLYLRDCDLSQMKSIKFNNDEDAEVFLWGTKFAGDIDLGDRKYIALMDADFSDVKTVKLSNRLYRAIKNQEVVIKGKKIIIKDLPKHGIIIERSNPFKIGIQKIQQKIADLRNAENSIDR